MTHSFQFGVNNEENQTSKAGKYRDAGSAATLGSVSVPENQFLWFFRAKRYFSHIKSRQSALSECATFSNAIPLDESPPAAATVWERRWPPSPWPSSSSSSPGLFDAAAVAVAAAAEVHLGADHQG